MEITEHASPNTCARCAREIRIIHFGIGGNEGWKDADGRFSCRNYIGHPEWAKGKQYHPSHNPGMIDVMVIDRMHDVHGAWKATDCPACIREFLSESA